jgi:hypothetical protein
MTGQRYAVLPIPEHPLYPHPCAACDGLGVTGDRYEMPTTPGAPILLVDVICPECGGCGNGDPEHADCPPEAHAYPEDYSNSTGEYDDDDQGDDGGPGCYSCGSGRGWNAVQGIGTSEGGDAEGLAVLRVPCGCSEGRLVLGDDPEALGAEAVTSSVEGERCPDCGRASCTGEDCYWPDVAGIARPDPDPRDAGFIGGYQPGNMGDE